MNQLLKKLIAGVSALTMCVSVMPLTASAATTSYKQGDINGDGIVNSVDVLALNKFLHGSVASKDSNTTQRLDVNSDCIIDQNDYVLLKNINLGLSSSNNPNYSSSAAKLPPQSTRGYYIFRASDSYLLDYYEIKPVSNISASSVSTYSIIGDDDRYLENGLNGVVALESGGTGFVVDKHTILTNAHCLLKDSSKLQCYNDIKIDIYSNNNTIEKSVTPVEYHIPSNYIDNSSSNYDYALITVQQDLSKYINFNLGVARNELAQKSMDIYATGFGADARDDGYEKEHINEELISTVGHGIKSTGKGFLSSTGLDNDYLIYYNTDVVMGNSGSPIYVIKDGIKTVIGIHKSSTSDHINGYNSGIRITSDILNFVYNNDNLSY